MVEHNINFYVYYGCIAGRNPIWLMKTLVVVVRIFDRIGLYTILVKTNMLVCTPDFIWCKQVEVVYNRREMG